MKRSEDLVLCRPGSDLLSRVLRRSTIGAEGLNGRVRNGIGYGPLARTTRPAKRKLQEEAGRPDAAHPEVDIVNESDQADRAISTSQLNALLRLHIWPINVVVFHGSI